LEVSGYENVSGNTGKPYKWTFKIGDTHAPNISDNSQDFITTGDDFTFNVSASDNTGVDQMYVTYRIDSSDPLNVSLTNAGGTFYERTISIPSGARIISYYFSANDTLNNWDETGQIDLNVTDDDEPSIADISPMGGTTGDIYRIRASIKDNRNINQTKCYYWTDVSGPVNVSMTRGGGGYYETTILIPSEATTIHYNISANDPSNNWVQTGQIDKNIIDNDAPDIIDNSPKSAMTGDNFTFNGSVADNIEIKNVYAYYWTNTSNQLNEIMTFTGGSYYEKTITIPAGGKILHYRLSSTDTTNNYANTEQTEIIITDNDAPTITDNSQDSGITGENFTFNGSLLDNRGVFHLYVHYWTDASGPHNMSLKEVRRGYYEKNITIPLGASILSYYFSGSDTSNNWASTGVVDIDITDNRDPVAKANDIVAIEGQRVEFDGNRSYDNVGIVNFSWTCEEVGLKLYGKISTYIFENAGSYEMTLFVHDDAGNNDTDTFIVTVEFDTDSDGIRNGEDAFPSDPAASIDTDGDGYPDRWNNGKMKDDSTTGLRLDKYPDNPEKWEEEEDSDRFLKLLGVFAIVVVIGIVISLLKKWEKI